MQSQPSSNDPFDRWREQAAKYPGFIGYALALLRERSGQLEAQQRSSVDIPLDPAYDAIWLQLQALSMPREGNHFASDVERIAGYVAQKAQEDHHLTVSLNSQGLRDLLVEARGEMAVQLTARQPFVVTVDGVEVFVATGEGDHYSVYLPERAKEAAIDLQVAPSGGDEYVAEWVHRIRACETDEQAARLLASFSLTMAEAMMHRAIDSLCDLLGVPRAPGD